MVEILDGAEIDGLKYFVGYEHSHYLVRVTALDGRTLSETFAATYNPIFGPDIADTVQADHVIDRLCAELRK